MTTVLKEPLVRKLTVGDYYTMAEAGIITPSERVELLNGRIIQMSPIGPVHQTVVDKLNEIFVTKAENRYRVRVGGPIRIRDYSEPQPDLVLYRRDLQNKHPEPADIYLVVEVSDTTLHIDTGEKLHTYESGQISEYWVVDLSKKAIRIYMLEGTRYSRRTRTQGTLAPREFLDVSVDISSLF